MSVVEGSSRRSKILGTILLSVIVLAVASLVPFTIGLSKGGFSIESIRDQYSIYLVSAIAGLLVIVGITIFEKVQRKGDIIYGDGLGFDSAGEIPHVKGGMFDKRIRL